MTEQLKLTADIVSAFLAGNRLPAAELPALITSVHAALATAATGEKPAEPLKPAVSIKRSITADAIICLEDGRAFKSLKRHLGVLGLTPDAYRRKWGLPADYPMVAPNYSQARSALAKQTGLGRKPKAAVRVRNGRHHGALHA